MKVNGYLRGMAGVGVVLGIVSSVLIWVHYSNTEDYEKLSKEAMLEIVKTPRVVARLDTLETNFSEMRTALEQHFGNHP
jgi:hypothetical protein